MAGYSNNMSLLLKKIQRRLGLIPLCNHLPDEYNVGAWAEVIQEETIESFSRFYPRKVKFVVNDMTAPLKDGWRYLDEDYVGGQKILGVADIDWSDFTNNSLGLAQQFGYGLPDVGMTNFSIADIQTLSMRANYASMFNNQLIPEFQYPNKLRLTAVGQNSVDIGEYAINLYVCHLKDLSSIPPTVMETFEQLAQADVATFLVRNLKYYDGLETVFASIDLKLSDLENEAGKRENIIDKLESNYVSAGNDSIPYIITV